MLRKIFLVLHFLCCLILLEAHVSPRKDMKIILFLIDGYRWDYTNDPFLKGIPRIIENGVRAPYVTPVYPSISFPNWYSIVTGLYSESHGFVGNEMYDQDKDEFFHSFTYPDERNTRPFWWNEAEPIWVTAEKNGLTSALYWWAGCEAEIRGKRPKICEEHRYGPGTESEKNDILLRVDDVLQMFKRDELSLAQIYYGPVDYNGHNFGPNSSAREQALYAIDDVLDKAQQQIEREGLEDQVNILVVSDHGMTESNEKNTDFIDIDPFSNKIQYQVAFGTASMLLPKSGKLDKLYSELKHAGIKGLNMYKKEQIPENYHFKNNRRVLPLLLQAQKGYLIKPLNDSEKIKHGPLKVYAGVHGYDPITVQDMRTIFFARGPAFKKEFISPPLSNVDHYNLMCHILGLTPLPNNGSWDKVRTMLVDEGYSTPSNSNVIFKGDLYVTLLIAIMCYFTLTKSM